MPSKAQIKAREAFVKKYAKKKKGSGRSLTPSKNSPVWAKRKARWAKEDAKKKGSKSKLTASHKALIKKDVKANRELYTTNVTSLGGFDPSMLVDSRVYTKINRDFGNTRLNNNPTQEKVDDLIADYLLTLKLKFK